MTDFGRLGDALAFAAALHGQQRRRLAGEPYLSHLLAVAATVMEHGGDEDETIAALLHDAVEDQGGPPTREEICRRFGRRVAEIVDGCTDATETPKPPWRQRKERHLARLAEASASVRLILAADKLHNARSIAREHRRLGEAIWGHFRGGREGTLWYYRRMADVLRNGLDASLADELEEAIAKLDHLA